MNPDRVFPSGSGWGIGWAVSADPRDRLIEELRATEPIHAARSVNRLAPVSRLRGRAKSGMIRPGMRLGIIMSSKREEWQE
jgi:hypothetical protein